LTDMKGVQMSILVKLTLEISTVYTKQTGI